MVKGPKAQRRRCRAAAYGSFLAAFVAPPSFALTHTPHQIAFRSFTGSQRPRDHPFLSAQNACTFGVNCLKKLALASAEIRTDCNGSVREPWTSAVLNITYDGTHFFGWSAANDPLSSSFDKAEKEAISEPNDDERLAKRRDAGADFLPPLNTSLRQKGRGRRRGVCIPGITKIRSVEGVLRGSLAKLYGNVDPLRVQVEGCSRTDKGVHASSMIALFYCLTEESAVKANAKKQGLVYTEEGGESTANIKEFPREGRQISVSVPGKRIPHPSSSTDASSFMPLPCNEDLPKILFCLNRMLPPDVRISAISPTPNKAGKDISFATNTSWSNIPKKFVPFHPTLDALQKTYHYTFSTGDIHDPLRWRHVWHIDSATPFDLAKAQEAADFMVGTHDFAAFRGAFRGKDRRRVQDTVCTLSELTISREFGNAVDVAVPALPDGPIVGASCVSGKEKMQPVVTHTVTVTGDRFLYKMVRFLVGALVSVGLGKITVQDVTTALDSRRVGTRNGQQRVCAPPHGLLLKNVIFGTQVDFEWTR